MRGLCPLTPPSLARRAQITHTKTERKALEDTHHPFLVHLRFAFQTPTKLYLVMDYCNGGELFFHLKTAGRFTESRARLCAAARPTLRECHRGCRQAADGIATWMRVAGTLPRSAPRCTTCTRSRSSTAT